MSENFNNGWQLAVDWIYKETKLRSLDFGYNPKGNQVAEEMSSLPKESGYDAGFGEGLIYAIGTPISELKKVTTKP